MDDARQQAYLTLINTLLTCPNGEEGQIVQDNAELADAGLRETIVRVAQVWTHREDKNVLQTVHVRSLHLLHQRWRG
jgi:hypothetical protein